MLEKLKDFFYDCSDTLLSLFIVLIMALVITWKLSGAMSIPLFNNTNDPSKKIIAENPQNVEIGISDNNEDNNTKPDNTVSQENTNQETTTDSTANSDTEVEVVRVEAKDIKIEIPKGTIGAGIAKILQERGLIENTSDFLNRVEELELSPKLRYGTFTIKSDSSIDQMITIITGVSINN